MIQFRVLKVFAIMFLINIIPASAAFAAQPTFEQRLDFRLKKMPERLQIPGKSAVFEPSPRNSQTITILSEFPIDTYFSVISGMEDNIVIGSMAGDTQRIRYKYLAEPSTPLYAYSVTKFIIGFLVAEQVCNGKMALVDKGGDLSDRLKGTAFEDVSLGSILGMYSGVHKDADDFISENLTKNNQSYREIVYQGLRMYEQLKKKRIPDAEPNTHWQYSNFDSNALALILSDRLGQRTGELFKDSIWNHIDPEHFGYWETDGDGEAMGGYGLALSATDWLKVGRRLALQIGNSKCLRNHYFADGFDTYKNNYAIWVNHSWANPDNRYQFGGIGHDGQILAIDVNNGNVIFIYSNKSDGYDEHISTVTWKLLSEIESFSQ